MNDYTPYVIYRIVCFPTAKQYIGQTNDSKLRERTHFSLLKKNKHSNRKLQFAYNKYGRDSFFFEVIETDVSREDSDKREQYWIECYDSYLNGFNQTLGGYSNNGGTVVRPCVWNGIEYKSQTQAARALGITPSAMVYRVKRGYSCDSDMPGCESSNPGISVMWDGVKYQSISEAARELGITKQAMNSRYRKNYTSLDDIPKNPGGTGHGTSFTWNGINYSTITAAAIANNVKTKTMIQRRQRGSTCDADLRKYPDSIVWNGEVYCTITEAAAANKKSYERMASYVRKGYACDDDISTLGQPIPVMWDGVTYRSYDELACVKGVSRVTIKNWISSGASGDSDLFGKRHNFPKVCTWNGTIYKSIAQASRALNITWEEMNRRLKLGFISDGDLENG